MSMCARPIAVKVSALVSTVSRRGTTRHRLAEGVIRMTTRCRPPVISNLMRTSKEFVLRPCEGEGEWPALVRIWRSAVEATHDFLTAEDIDFYESRMLSDYFPAVELTVAEFEETPVAFSGLVGNSLEMLFVDSSYRGHGVGSALLSRAIERHPDLRLDVNEQNPHAAGFYQRHGFVVLSRSATDSDGRPFPILHMGRSTIGADTPIGLG